MSSNEAEIDLNTNETSFRFFWLLWAYIYASCGYRHSKQCLYGCLCHLLSALDMLAWNYCLKCLNSSHQPCTVLFMYITLIAAFKLLTTNHLKSCILEILLCLVTSYMYIFQTLNNLKFVIINFICPSWSQDLLFNFQTSYLAFLFYNIVQNTMGLMYGHPI